MEGRWSSAKPTASLAMSSSVTSVNVTWWQPLESEASAHLWPGISGDTRVWRNSGWRRRRPAAISHTWPCEQDSDVARQRNCKLTRAVGHRNNAPDKSLNLCLTYTYASVRISYLLASVSVITVIIITVNIITVIIITVIIVLILALSHRRL